MCQGLRQEELLLLSLGLLGVVHVVVGYPVAGELWNWWESWEEEVKEVFELRASGF